MLRQQEEYSATTNNKPPVVDNNVSMPSVGGVNATENDNVYVRELRRMFDSCATKAAATSARRSSATLNDDDDDENEQDVDDDDENIRRVKRRKNKDSLVLSSTNEYLLDQHGLEKLCNELHLQNHRDYIVGQLIPSENGRLTFDAFKIKFIQLLPEIVEFSTSIDETNRFALGSEQQRRGGGVENSVSQADSHREEEDVVENGALNSDNDTSNDILSEFSDDDNNDRRRNDEIVVVRTSGGLATQNNNSDSSPLRHPIAASKQLTNNNNNNSNNCRMINADEVEHILSELGLADRGYLGRYELRILCQHLGLNGLTPQELTILFNQLDKDGDGKISVSDFLTVCPQASTSTTTAAQQTNGNNTNYQSNNNNSTMVVVNNNVGGAANNVNSTMNGRKYLNGKSLSGSTLTLFSTLDHSKTGHAKVSDLLQYWSSIGVEDGSEILKKLGIAENHWINLKLLCDALYGRLNERIDDDELITAAVLTLKAEILHLKETFDESRDQASFYLRELQQLNQRNSLLVEELDQSQQNLEMRSQVQLRELEDKHHGRIIALESKYKSEREQFHNELRDRDELLHRMQQNEAGLQSRLRQTERENLRLKSEVDDLSQTVKELEDINREMRLALQDASSSGRKFLNVDKYKSKKFSSLNGASVYNSSLHGSRTRKALRQGNGPISAPLLAKRPVRRKLLPNETSDFESDPEPILTRAKLKRPLKKKQRLALVAHRMPVERIYDDQTASTSSSTSSEDLSPICYDDERRHVSCTSSTVNGCCSAISTQLTALEKQLSDERKFLAHELRMEVTTLEEEHLREKQRLVDKYEQEKRHLTGECKKQLEIAGEKHSRDKEAALIDLELDLRRKFEDEKRDLEIRWASERNVAERRFAEEKMAIMERLQNEFEMELKRVKFSSKVSPTSSQSDVSMSHSADRQRLEKALNDKTQLETTVNNLLNDLQTIRAKLNDETSEKARLLNRLEEIQTAADERCRSTRADYETANEELKSEIRRLNDDAQRLLTEIETLRKNLDVSNKRKLTNVASIGVQNDAKLSCDECSTLKFQLQQLKNDQILSSSLTKTISELKATNDELRERLTAADERATELQTYLCVADSQRLRYAVAERRPFEWTSSTESACDGETTNALVSPTPTPTTTNLAVCEKLKEENFLLNARLNEQRRLTEDLTLQLHEQMKETSKVALVAQNFYTKFCQLEENAAAENQPSLDLSNVKQSVGDLYVEVDRLLK